jgi:hypothetical protein
MICTTVRVFWIDRMVRLMKDNLPKECSMERVFRNGVMEIFMKETLLIQKDMELEN